MTTGSETPTGAMRVGYVLKRYPRFSETFIVNEILALEAIGIEVVVFALRPALEGCFHEQLARVQARVEYLPAAGQKSAQLLNALRTANAHPPFKFDLNLALATEPAELEQALVISHRSSELGVKRLHAHFATTAASVARLASHFTGIPYSVTAHAKDIFHDSVDPDRLHERLRDAQSVVTVSDFNVRYLTERWPDIKARITRIYNGMDLSRLEHAPYADRSRRVLAVGRLVPKKGFGVLLDAVPSILKRHPDVQFDLVGEGELRDELQARATALGLSDCVHFHGARSQGQVFELLRHASLFAAPCVVSEDGDRDGLPTVLLEAMALGTPCVATPVTGIPEAIDHGVTGLLVEPGNAHALACTISELLSDAVRARALSVTARQHIEDRFDISRTAKQLASIWSTRPLSRMENLEVAK